MQTNATPSVVTEVKRSADGSGFYPLKSDHYPNISLEVSFKVLMAFTRSFLDTEILKQKKFSVSS